MSQEKSKIITLDAINWQTRQDFYRDFCRHTSAPRWFGNNLDALRDSLADEGVLLLTPKKIIIINLSKKIKQQVGEKFFRQINDICAEMSVELEIYPENP